MNKKKSAHDLPHNDSGAVQHRDDTGDGEDAPQGPTEAPIASGESEPSDASEDPGGWALRGCSILLVEDDEAFSDLLSWSLQQHGYEVETANDAEEAVRRLDEGASVASPFDLVISDVRLPRGSGTDLLFLDVLQTTPLILMTAFASAELRAFVEDCGSELLEKPFPLEALSRRVLERLRSRLMTPGGAPATHP